MLLLVPGAHCTWLRSSWLTTDDAMASALLSAGSSAQVVDVATRAMPL